MEFINNNANIFFFVTTIFVMILIILAVILVAAAVKFYKFITRAIDQGDVLLEEAKSNNFVKKAAPFVMPIVLPIISFFAKKKSKKK
ncbi:hypothetical protein H7X65_00670 [Candidatus Parcubacteria bacterium]|nr:hypothetical protein [Candidatus Parcubacteria bacterium]